MRPSYERTTMIYVWILSYFATYLLGVFTLAIVLVLIATKRDRKIDAVEREFTEYAEAQPRIVPKRSSLL